MARNYGVYTPYKVVYDRAPPDLLQHIPKIARVQEVETPYMTEMQCFVSFATTFNEQERG